jgi:LytS/YehU family sensor histidine kinase
MKEKLKKRKWFRFINYTLLARLFIFAAIAFPIISVVHYYVHGIVNEDQEVTTFLFSIFFILMLMTGRYVSQLWIDKNGNIPNRIIGWSLFLFFVSLFISLVVGEDKLGDQNGGVLVAIPFTICCIIAGILIKLIRTRIKKRIEVAETRAEQSENELKLLQSQLSPHFLFNTLNNLYGLALTKHDQLPALLLKLSDLLRYSVYDAKESLVPLKDELAYIRDYIAFERIRIGDKLSEDIFIEEVNDTNIRIAPLLLIVFVENAFKHSKNSAEEKIRITITIKTWAGFILVSVGNSKSGSSETSGLLKNESGLGLENVKKRLELQYHGEYDLDIQEGETFYQVNLKLKAK